MKHHLTSISSTKPEQFLYTDFSSIAPTQQPTSLKNCLTRILAYIKNILKINMRLYLTAADFEELYQMEAGFWGLYMDAYSATDLWGRVAGLDGDRVAQRGIMGLFTKLIIAMTKEKNNCAQGKKFEKFAQLKTSIQWLQDRMVQLEQLIRDRIKEQAIKKRKNQQNKREEFFEQKASTVRAKLDENIEEYQNMLRNRHKKEINIIQNVISDNIEKQSHLYVPSKKLHQAKQISLLAKLAPYKSQKKRPYECKSLQKQLNMTIQLSKQKMQQNINQYRQKQRQRIKRKHMMERQIYLDKLEEKNMQTLAKIQLKKNQLDKSEQIKMQKLLADNEKATKQRVLSLRKSLNAYSMKDESAHIRKIVKEHRENVQFINNIQQLQNTSLHRMLPPSSYVTLQVLSEATKQKKQKRYSDQFLEGKILRKIKKQNNTDNAYNSNGKSAMQIYNDMSFDQGLNRTLNAKKSLASLYDQNLQKI